MTEATWLPNLVAGTSIWKLAVDLNEPKFFDGRLLVPETEGSESLPVTVRWDLTGLIPLSEARAKHPDETATALRDFQSALERVAKVFSTPNSGFDKYKGAFTVPALDADGGAHYFYSPSHKKVFVINWGASPRSMGGKAEYVFGFEDWGKHWGDLGAPAPAAAIAPAAAVAAVATPVKTEAEKKKEDKKEERNDPKSRPWWIWPLFAIVVIVLVLLALFLLKACEEPKVTPSPDGQADALVEGALPGEGGAEAGAEEAGAEAGAEDASADAAGADGGDASADAAAADAGKDGGDGGFDPNDDDDDELIEGSSGGAGGGTSGGASGGTVIVKIGPGGGTKTSVHRKHYSGDAIKWRIAAGAHKISRTEERGQRFDVWLAPGQTFEGVRIEWQDKAGKWHVH